MERVAWGFSLFADDLRSEIGSKISLMGIYRAEMIFPSDFPVAIPKFVILVNYYEDRGALDDDLMLKIELTGVEEPIYTKTMERKEIGNFPTIKPKDEDTSPIISIMMPIIFSPLMIPAEGDIKVRMHCGKVITRLGRLSVRKVRPDENIQFSP